MGDLNTAWISGDMKKGCFLEWDSGSGTQLEKGILVAKALKPGVMCWVGLALKHPAGV